MVPGAVAIQVQQEVTWLWPRRREPYSDFSCEGYSDGKRQRAKTDEGTMQGVRLAEGHV